MERKLKTDHFSAGRRGKRADHWIREQFPGLTGRQILEGIQGNLVCTAGGKSLSKGDYFSSASELNFDGLRERVEKLRKGNPQLNCRILHEDENIVVIDKPVGMSSHPVSLFDFDTVSHWALAQYPEVQSEFPQVQPTVTPHRLDGGTSGVQIVAKKLSSYELWRGAFRKKEIEKKYLAWCWGKPERDSFEVDLPLGHDSNDPSRIVPASEGALFRAPVMLARTVVGVLEEFPDDGVFLAGVVCRTGATHQVRVHLASIGYPLVGDTLYDIDFAARKIRSLYHQLRAVELSGLDLVLKAPTEFFYSSFVRALSGLYRE